MKTQFVKKGEAERKWYVVDAGDKVLGRLAVKIASRLRGKDSAKFTPHADAGDFVVVVNADKVKLTGNKLKDKVFYTHSNYPGGLRAETAGDRLKDNPEYLIKDAVWGMLPKNRLGRKLIGKLKVYRGADHPHKAQKPAPLEF